MRDNVSDCINQSDVSQPIVGAIFYSGTFQIGGMGQAGPLRKSC